MSLIVDNSNSRIDGRLVAIILAAVCICMICAGLVVEGQPVLAVAVVLAAVGTVCLLRWPDTIVPLVLFVLYSNAVVVGVRFHGVPKLVAGLVPAPLAIPLFIQVVILRKPVIAGPALPWMLALTGWQLVSAMLSRDPSRAIDGVVGTVLEGVLLYVLVVNVIRDRHTLRRSVWALIAAGAFMGSISAYQQATGSFDSDLGGFGQLSDGRGFSVEEGRGKVRQRRLAGPIGEKNRYAQVMMVLIPLALSCFWTHRNHLARLAALYGATIICIGAALTFSRSGAIAFVLMVVLATVLRLVSAKSVATLFIGGLLVLVVVPQYRTRLATIPNALGLLGKPTPGATPDGAIRGRATEMIAAARIAMDHPILGVGPDMSAAFIAEYGQAGGLRALEGNRQAHCMFLEIPAETGFPGFIMFMAMLACTLHGLLRSSFAARKVDDRLAQTGLALVLSMSGYLVMGIFLHLSYVRYFWLLLALCDASSYVMRQAAVEHQPAEDFA